MTEKRELRQPWTHQLYKKTVDILIWTISPGSQGAPWQEAFSGQNAYLASGKCWFDMTLTSYGKEKGPLWGDRFPAWEGKMPLYGKAITIDGKPGSPFGKANSLFGRSRSLFGHDSSLNGNAVLLNLTGQILLNTPCFRRVSQVNMDQPPYE